MRLSIDAAPRFGGRAKQNMTTWVDSSRVDGLVSTSRTYEPSVSLHVARQVVVRRSSDEFCHRAMPFTSTSKCLGELPPVHRSNCFQAPSLLQPLPPNIQPLSMCVAGVPYPQRPALQAVHAPCSLQAVQLSSGAEFDGALAQVALPRRTGGPAPRPPFRRSQCPCGRSPTRVKF